MGVEPWAVLGGSADLMVRGDDDDGHFGDHINLGFDPSPSGDEKHGHNMTKYGNIIIGFNLGKL